MKKKVLVLGLILGLIVFSLGSSILAQENETQPNQEVVAQNQGDQEVQQEDQNIQAVASEENEEETEEEEMEEIPVDLSGEEIVLPKVYRGKGVRASLLITPAGIVKLTRAVVTEVDYNNKSGKVKVWGMEFKVDASSAYVVKYPIYRILAGKKVFGGIKGIPFEKSRIKVGDKVNIIGKVVDDSSYPILIKAKVIKNISRRQPKVIVLKEILKKKISAIGKKIKEEAKKEKIKKEVKKEIGKRIKNKASVGDIQKRIQEILERIRALQTQLGR